MWGTAPAWRVERWRGWCHIWGRSTWCRVSVWCSLGFGLLCCFEDHLLFELKDLESPFFEQSDDGVHVTLHEHVAMSTLAELDDNGFWV